jgi:hypothetical protein
MISLAVLGRPRPYELAMFAGGFVTAAAGLGVAAQDLPELGLPLDTLIAAAGFESIEPARVLL